MRPCQVVQLAANGRFLADYFYFYFYFYFPSRSASVHRESKRFSFSALALLNSFQQHDVLALRISQHSVEKHCEI
jgi:hypothetical protein